MVKIRLKYRKIAKNEPAKCWYCNAKTWSALTEIDGSEIWCCKKCHKKHGVVYKRRSKKTKENEIISDNNKGKNDKNDKFQEVLDG